MAQSLVRITFKTADSDGNFDDFAVMDNETIDKIAAGLYNYQHSLASVDANNPSAQIVYERLEVVGQYGSMPQYRTVSEGDSSGFRAMTWIDRIRSINIVMVDVEIDPHGYVQKTKHKVD